MKKLKTIFELDDEGWWVASIPSIDGCHSQGRSIEQARNRVKEALGLFLDGIDSIELLEQIKLPDSAKNIIEQAQQARRRADTERNNAQKLTSEAVFVLQQKLNLSVRDIAAILGLSHQRIHQLINS